MNKILLSALIISLISCNNGQENFTVDEQEIIVDSVPKEDITTIDLKTIMDAFDYKKDRFKAIKKYGEKLLKVKGRTSGVGEDGILTMQLEPGDEALWCYDLPDSFLLTINKNDIVEITGRFGRTGKGFSTRSILGNCTDYKKMNK